MIFDEKVSFHLERCEEATKVYVADMEAQFQSEFWKECLSQATSEVTAALIATNNLTNIKAALTESGSYSRALRFLLGPPLRASPVTRVFTTRAFFLRARRESDGDEDPRSMSNEALRKKAKRPTGQPLNCFRCNRKFQAHFKDCVEIRVAGGALKPRPISIGLSRVAQRK